VSRDEFSGVDIDLLADYVGGALDGTPDHATVAGLIARDPAWRAAHDALAEGMTAVGRELGALGAAPEPMPAEFAVRLDAAFGSGIADPAPIDPELATPVVPHLKPVRGDASGRHLTPVPDIAVDRPGGERDRLTAANRRRKLRWAVPIAAAAGVLAFAGLGIDYLAGGTQSTSDNATTSAGGAARAENAPMAASDQPQVAAPPAAGQIRSSGVNYDRATLRDASAAAFKAPVPKAASDVPGSATDSVASPLARLRPPDALLACLDAIAQANGAGTITVQTVDYARFEGSPALVVRFSAANGGRVWASGPACGAPGSGAATIASLPVG
jgi:hypothetical protein